MTGILASSKIGADAQNLGVTQKLWNIRSNPPSISVNQNPVVYASYKSKTLSSDGKRPTSYVRMVTRLTPGGPYECHNRSYNVKGPISHTVGVKRINLPFGCTVAGGQVGVPSAMLDNVILAATAELQQLNANILEDLGQLKQTGDLVADIVKLIYDLYVACRYGNFKAVRRRLAAAGSNVPKTIANGWLMYFYGILPLISTIDALSKQQPINRTMTVRKRVTERVDPRQYSTAATSVQFSGKAEVQAQCSLTASIRMSGNMHTLTNLGVTGSSITDLLVTGWALAPYSFVVDWFIPIEGWLRSLAWTSALNYQYGYTGKRHVCDASFVDYYPWSSSGGPYTGTLPTGRLRVLFYQRTAYLSTIPFVNLSIRFGLNSTQIISASALITQKG